MKKLLVTIVAVMAVSAVQAQSLKDEILACVKSSTELETLLSKQPKACGEDEIDAYENAVVAVANQAVDNSKKLMDIYDKLESNQATVTDLLDDANKLKDSIEKEGKDFKDAQSKAGAAAKRVVDLTNEVASANALAKVKAGKKLKNSTSVLNFTKDCSTTLAKETVTQAAVVVKLVSAITSKK